MRYTLPMATPLASPRRPATLRDLDDLPEDVIGHIVGGELIVLPRPDMPHALVATTLAADLVGPFRRGIGGPGGWIIAAEPKIQFGEDLFIPDLAGWRRERFSPPLKGPTDVAPDWICEILSPSTARFDRFTKLPIYARARVGYTWLIDPSSRTLEVLQLQEEKWLITGMYQNEDKVRAEPFEAIELDLALLWEDVPADPEAAGSEEGEGAQLP
ncbi:MAG TPA: Uma2 family endonuclease [Thermoanaerobaculia bacterium]|nr:Uma2 family endonuclease [Thermoanaerobaculia bacterium]